MDNRSKFLSETKYCDIRNPEIEKLKDELINQCNGNEVCYAIQIFNWVRNEIKYSFDFWNVKASETLHKKSGMCANKANLQIALLRSSGIPAGYMVLRIKKEALRCIAIDELYDKSSDAIVHVYCCVLLNGEWTGADASVDIELYNTAYINVPDWHYVEWNGHDHLHIHDNYILDATGPYSNIDEYMDMPHRFMNDEIKNRSNLYIEKIRSNTRSFVDKI